MKLIVKKLEQGDWDRYRNVIVKIEKSAFTPQERTNKWVFRELINKYTPYTTIFYYGRIPIGYYMAATLEDSSEKDEFKKIDKYYNKKNTLYLFSIGVKKEYQKLGVGKQMLEHLIKMASKKFKRLSFHTKNKNFRRMAFNYGFRVLKYVKMDGYRMGYMAKWLRKE